MADQRLINKGHNVPLIPLVDQTGVSIARARRDEALLAEFGFPPSRTDEMEQLKEELQSERARYVEQRSAAREKVMTEREAQTEAKAHKRRLVLAADDLVADGIMTTTDRNTLNRGTLGRSTPKILGWFIDTQEIVNKYAADFSPLMASIDVPDRHRVVFKNLESSQVAQETALADLPADTAELYEKKGRLLDLIERLIRAGKRAHDGDAQQIALYNKDILLRASKPKKKAAATKAPSNAEANKDAATPDLQSTG